MDRNVQKLNTKIKCCLSKKKLLSLALTFETALRSNLFQSFQPVYSNTKKSITS